MSLRLNWYEPKYINDRPNSTYFNVSWLRRSICFNKKSKIQTNKNFLDY